MLRIHVSNDAAGAKSYFSEGLSRQDYYAEDQEIVGEWGGKAAARLRLAGPVEKQAFNRLCDNQHPDNGEALTARTKEGRRVGYDLSFHCPKSLSVLYAHTGDARLLDAFRASVKDTMQEMETEMRARVRKDNGVGDRVTGNMVWAEFVHFTARPVGGMPDPHLHAHCFTFNATYDQAEKQWKAGEFVALNRDATYYEAAFHARLAARVEELGIATERRGKAWEVSGVPDSVLEKFSRRTAQVERLAAEKGITSAAEKDKLAALSRENKNKGLGMDDLRSAWASAMTPEERAAVERAGEGRGERGGNGRITAKDAMAYAVANGFERQSVVAEKRLLADALRYGVGSVEPQRLAQELSQPGLIRRERDGQKLCTTVEVMTEERRMIDFARDGRGVCAPLAKGKAADHAFQDTRLTDEQRGAVQHILGSPDQVIAIKGAAGVGKTTLMTEAIRVIEASGHKVFTFAPSADAARDVLRGEGFKNADTVAALLHNPKMQQAVKGGVLWVDEAGLLGSPTMGRLFKVAQEQGCRVVLAGDTGQHTAVERGDGLRVLQDYAGIKPAEVTRIIRQKSAAYRSAVQDLSEGAVGRAFAKLDRMGAFIEAESGLADKLAADYVETIKRGKTALVVSPTHGEGGRVSEAIRERMRESGFVQGPDREVGQLRNLQLTEAERGDAARYLPGQIIQAVQNLPGLARGERATVDGREGGQVFVRTGSGGHLALPLDKARQFQVYEARALAIAAGDVVRITQNGQTAGKKQALNNGSLHRIAGFTPSGDLRLGNGWVIPRNFGHLAHGYVTTSHASQGKSVDEVMIAQSADSFGASSREQFYVSASRGKERIRVYTDDLPALRRAVERSTVRTSATELARPAPRPPIRTRERLRTVARLGQYARTVAARGRQLAERFKLAGKGRSMEYE